MSDLTIYPAQLTEMSVAQLETLPPDQLAEVQHNLEQLQDWTKQAKAKLDTALFRRFGELARTARADSGKDFGTVHFSEGPLRVTVDQPKRVSWDQPQLAAIAQRIAASGERVEDYLDVEFSVPESRFNNWPIALRSQFGAARTVKPGKPSFRLTFTEEA
ncbi:hypothetical protein [Serpentinimonas maccroryi]|uniref:hypothetical protein n=1 Tax=Serpentinimonas maccroryi TaxID=1458426 RepID=UPI0020334EE3|nr:hypothetical protein [Serpentinimonas maccroryi]MCM2479176.1 hypothetical protein [Serpentinimonas maccroryi]